MTILVKNIKSNKISETQLQVLLGYAEEDIYDQSRQATAFGLLKVTLEGISPCLPAPFRRRSHLCVRLGHPVQEAGGAGDGGRHEEGGHAVRHGRQRHDQGSLSTGTDGARSLKPPVHASLQTRRDKK